MNELNIVCTACPMGCSITATVDEHETLVSVAGHRCRRGEAYARAEIANPARSFHSTLRVAGGDLPMVSVKTAAPVPKSTLMACAEATRDITANAPIAVGDVLLRDIAGTGVDLVATTRVLPCSFS
ncbi:MAG: DUF1667 domain-containing protein [Oscillospiraceae bacterium]|nr:DUF1667 domain-containing protein [Oscillospiraceae bacterium]